MKIMLALADASEIDEVLAWVEQFRARLNESAHFVMLHVVPLVAQGTAGVLEGYAAADLDEMWRAAHPLDVRLRAGVPGPSICEEAVGFDLLVLGASHHSLLSEWVWGTTAAYVTHHAPCDVLLRRRP